MNGAGGSAQTNLPNLIIDFNLFPVRYIHSSWLKKDKHASLIGELQLDPVAQFSLSAYLLRKFNLSHAFDYDFSRIEKRVAFASAEEIDHLIFYIGVVMNEEAIRSVLRREERLILKQLLGEDAYRFAVKKAQYISRRSGSGPSILIDWDHPERFKSYLYASGQAILNTAFSDASDAFNQRLKLKMPQNWAEAHGQAAAVDLSPAQCVTLLIKTHKEVNRQWRHLLS